MAHYVITVKVSGYSCPVVEGEPPCGQAHCARCQTTQFSLKLHNAGAGVQSFEVVEVPSFDEPTPTAEPKKRGKP